MTRINPPGRKRKDFFDLVGEKFNALTIKGVIGYDDHGDFWFLCDCDCGNEYKARKNHLFAKELKSCGCLRKKSNWENNYKVNELNGCWEWLGARLKSGYGFSKRICYIQGKKKNSTSHRLFYEKFKGKIPEGLFVCHKCDNPICCNPDHLFLGTAKDNVRDMMNKGRHFTQQPDFDGFKNRKKRSPFCCFILEEK